MDAYAPAEIADRVCDLGVSKAKSPTARVLVLAFLAGAFIALGGAFYSVTVTGGGAQLGLGPSRLLGGLAFSLGLILVVVAGAELFTGNNLLAMAWASGRIDTKDVLRNWLLVYAGNAAGSVALAGLVMGGAVHGLGGGAVGETVLAIGRHKAALPPLQAFCLGIGCNTLVCLAVWLCLAGHSVTYKVLAIVFPITAFVALGFEHSVANMFFLPWAIALDGGLASTLWAGAGRNLVAVTAGNMVGGTLLVAGVYWLAYLRDEPQETAEA